MKGLNLELERAHQDGTEWKFGGLSQPCLAAIPQNLREAYLPVGEVQKGIEDFEDCATRGPLNNLEAKFTYFRLNGMKPENRKWLEDNGYVGADGITFSDRFIAILSGTTRQGNSMKAPLEAIRKNGLIPKKMLPASPSMNFDAYHNRADITEAMIELGQEFARRFTINYEQVQTSRLLEALKDDMAIGVVYAWPAPVGGIYPRVEDPFNHVVLTFVPAYFVFDNYEEGPKDFVKRLAPNYKFFDYGYRVFISADTTPNEQKTLLQVFWELLKDGLLSYFPQFVKNYETKTPSITLPQPQPKKVKVEDLCLAIREHEGWFPGSRSYKNNNPGNCRYSSVGYAAKYLPVLKDAQNFAVFKNYATGWLYLTNLIRLKAQKHPTWTLLDLTKEYAPASDHNDPVRYAQVLREAVGVDETWTLENLT